MERVLSMAEKDLELRGRRAPVRVLHVTDTLGGGGTERLVWDIVRLSDPERVRHRVTTFFPEGHFGPFVYAERLRRLSAYGRADDSTSSVRAAVGENDYEAAPDSSGEATPDANGKVNVSASSDSAPEEQGGAARTSRGGLRAYASGVARALPEGPRQRLYSAAGAAASFRERRLVPAALHAAALRRIVAECARFRPDVINVHGFHPFSYGLFLKRVFRRPLVHMVPSAFSQMRDQGTGWLPRLYERHHARVDLFLLAAGYEPELLGVGVPEEKLLAFGGPVDVEAIEQTRAESERHRAEVRRRLGLPADALVALSVGRFHPSKGHQYAVEALPRLVARFPNLHWVVLGDGPGREEVERRAGELGVGANVHLVGFEPNPLPFYAAADVYLRTPVFEGDNLSSCQAIATGLPVVAFDTGSGADLVKRQGLGAIVMNENAAALSAATAHVLALPDRGRTLAAPGVDYCRAHLDIRRVVEKFISAYAGLHEGRRGVASLLLGESREEQRAATKR